MARLLAFVAGIAVGLALSMLAGCSTPSDFEHRALLARNATAILIGHDDEGASRGGGTAFAITPRHFATAYHVVDNDSLHFTVDGLRATVVFVDEANDTAVLEIHAPSPHVPLSVDCSRDWPAFATPLVSYGYGDGIFLRGDDPPRATLLRAYVASDWREPNPTDGYLFTVGGTIVHPGASGGAWVDDTGRVVGIVSMSRRHLGSGFPPTPMATVVSYAAPVFALCGWLEQQ